MLSLAGLRIGGIGGKAAAYLSRLRLRIATRRYYILIYSTSPLRSQVPTISHTKSLLQRNHVHHLNTNPLRPPRHRPHLLNHRTRPLSPPHLPKLPRILLPRRLRLRLPHHRTTQHRLPPLLLNLDDPRIRTRTIHPVASRSQSLPRSYHPDDPYICYPRAVFRHDGFLASRIRGFGGLVGGVYPGWFDRCGGCFWGASLVSPPFLLEAGRRIVM